MAIDEQVAVTRAGALMALKLLMIVLAAVIIWQSASALNTALQKRSLVTAGPFTHGLAKLVFGTETEAPFKKRMHEFWLANNNLVALAAILLAVALLVTRFLALGRVLDYMYAESPAVDKRIYGGFVANVFLALVHAGIIYGIVLVGREDSQTSLVPLTLMSLFLFNSIWAFGLYMTVRRTEKHDLRGLPYLALTSFAALLILGFIMWKWELRPPKVPNLRASQLTITAAIVAGAWCMMDAAIQIRIYCRRVKLIQR